MGCELLELLNFAKYNYNKVSTEMLVSTILRQRGPNEYPLFEKLVLWSVNFLQL